jgi:hypothetical protein
MNSQVALSLELLPVWLLELLPLWLLELLPL